MREMEEEGFVDTGLHGHKCERPGAHDRGGTLEQKMTSTSYKLKYLWFEIESDILNDMLLHISS